MHASFTSIVSAGIFAALYISSTASATPVDISVLEARAENPLAKCWAKGSSGSDEGISMPNYCRNANSPSFESYTTLLTYTDEMEYPRHFSKGPWHCCATCYNDPNCISWIYHDDCSCQRYINKKCATGDQKFSFENPTPGNVTGVFHKGNTSKCKPVTL